MGALPQPASIPTIAPLTTLHRSRFMVLILLEALGALALLLLIVWWTMFSGRKNGKLPNRHVTDTIETSATKPPPKSD